MCFCSGSVQFSDQPSAEGINGILTSLCKPKLQSASTCDLVPQGEYFTRTPWSLREQQLADTGCVHMQNFDIMYPGNVQINSTKLPTFQSLMSSLSPHHNDDRAAKFSVFDSSLLKHLIYIKYSADID